MKEKYFGVYWLISKLFYFSDVVVVPSTGIFTEFIELGYNQDQLRVINNFSDFELFREIKFEKSQRKYFIMVSRLIEDKRHIDFLKSYYKTKLYIEYDLLIVGDGNMKEKISSLINDLNISMYVKFIKTNDRLVLFKLFSQASFTINYSKYEGFPNVVLESLISGTPVLSCQSFHGVIDIFDYNGPIVNELICTKYGFLFPNSLKFSEELLNKIKNEKLLFNRKEIRTSILTNFNMKKISTQWKNL